MSDSLEKRNTELSRVRLKHLATFIDLILLSGITDIVHLRRRYCEQALDFDEALAFLTGISLVRRTDNEVRLDSILIETTDRRELGLQLLRKALESESPFRSIIASYLQNYQLINDQVLHNAYAEDSDKQYGVRNLLMDFGIVVYDGKAGIYVLDKLFFLQYSELFNSRPAITLDQFKKRMEDREALGLAAELVVLDFEKKRVGNSHSLEVKHIAMLDPGAGYDVQSVTQMANGSIQPRLIEVKAVPPDTLRFYWTANEIAAAEKLGPWYHLYLLPTGSGAAFKILDLVMIQDPYHKLIAQNEDWLVEPDVLKCQLKSRKQGVMSD